MQMRIIMYRVCIGMGKVSRRTRKRKFIIWKRLPLVDISVLDTTLETMSVEIVDTTERRSIISSLPTLKKGFKAGWVSKADFAAALRGHQAAIDAMKSPQRDEAEAFVALQSTVN
mmetsp:Transcript_3528/g.5139  ORF Transcript_3528/g.5139 Transcript_3528/m.5139 type:complete len:115 (+) Transcript_3528:693-1037(+)